MDTEHVLNQLLIMAGLLALPAPLLWVEAIALRRVPRLAGQPTWRQRLAVGPRAASVVVLLLAGAALAVYLYYRLNPPAGLQAFLEGRPLESDATAAVDGFYGFLATGRTITLTTPAVAYGIVLLGIVVLAQGKAPDRPAQTERPTRSCDPPLALSSTSASCDLRYLSMTSLIRLSASAPAVG